MSSSKIIEANGLRSRFAINKMMGGSRVMMVSAVVLAVSLLTLQYEKGQTSLWLPQSSGREDIAIDSNASSALLSILVNLSASSVTSAMNVTTDSSASAVTMQPTTKFFDLVVPEDQLEFCQANSFVHTSNTELPFKRPETAKPFSITKYSFQRHHKEYCSDSTQLLNAIRLGKRVWPSEEDDTPDDVNEYDDSGNQSSTANEKPLYNNYNMTAMEQLQSYFRPHGCDIPYMNQRDFCNIANLFSEIVVQGDSQSRHLSKAMLMIYRNNFIRGGNQPTSNNHVLEELHRCHCDSQFSSSKLCRENDKRGILMKYKPSQLHLCPQVPFDGQFVQNFAINRPNKVFQFQGNCSDPEHKGVLLVLQGGVHYRYSAVDTWRNLFLPILKQPKFLECAKVGKLTWIWTAYMSQSPTFDGKFSHQGLQRGLKFNREMKDLISKANLTLSIIDWIRLTYGAQRPDGLHFLSEVNVERAQHVMILAKMLRDEQGKMQTAGKFA